MKQKLLTFLFTFLICSVGISQVVANQVDDFEDSTTESWRIGGAGGASGPTNIATGGPAGAGDHYLQYVSDGTPPPGANAASKMIIINTNQWLGDYTSQVIVAIRFAVKAETNDLNLRVAFDGSGGRFCTTNAISITAGASWQTVEIPISSTDFTSIGGANIVNTLANVGTMRILSNGSPAWEGEIIAATIGLDNIKASTTFLSTKENKINNAFSINPNPGRTKLNLKLSRLNANTNLEVFDVLGKKIYANRLNSLTTSIDVFKWNSGVYLVRITNDSGTQTKRFVKQ